MILEEASLELVPRKLQTHASSKRVEQSFGVRPEMQILDSNFHKSAMLNLSDLEKRGRPDVVHFALLDVTSTPLFSAGRVKVVIHTIGGKVITLKTGTRPPRTLQRFCGVMAKLLSSKEGEAEGKLFEVNDEMNFLELLSLLEIERTISLTKQGIRREISGITSGLSDKKRTAWVVGGFAHGHFEPEVTRNSNEIVSICDESLAAHVVTARMCYELEKSFRMQ